jgi:hypothetical protein
VKDSKKLVTAFVYKCYEIGHGNEGKAFIATVKKERDPDDGEKAIICAWADGILYGNWPWKS